MVVLWLSLYLVLTTNWPLWNELARIGGAPSSYMSTVVSMSLLTLCGSAAILSFTAWSRWMKPLWLLVVILAAVVQHYMLEYRVVMDPTMIANALQTDPNEARDLLSWRMAFNVAVVVLPAAWLIWRVRVAPMRFLPKLARNVGLLLLSVAVAVGTAVAMNRELAPLMRNNVHLRYMMNPIASLYSTGALFIKPLFKRSGKLVSITTGTALGASYAAQTRPPLFVVVVGETARADHFALNGYARDTTPELAKRGVLSYREVRSCGTNTLASVPCMFSPLGKEGYESRKDDYETLVDVLQAAGLAVFWLDNQAGCKGVCERIPNASAFDGLDAATKKALCDGDECLDDVMLKGLDARIAALPAERRAKGVVLVMHQMGSHGPAYFKRSPADLKPFQPECKSNALQQCERQQVVNGYDNTLVTTDRLLARSIAWLQGQKTFDVGMLYVSDHGESLGENGLYLHGMPYAMAPAEQTHVPMVLWVPEGGALAASLKPGCLQSLRDKPASHDNLFHTAMGWVGARADVYKPEWDLLAGCRN